MPIINRDSDAHLCTEKILEKISAYDIFKYYCTVFKNVKEKFCSELRGDKNPSASIIEWKSSLLYKDFGYPEHTFDCFGYIMAKYSCGFYDALLIIDNDFNLNLASRKSEINFTMGYVGYKSNIKIQPKQETIIRKRRRKWAKEDKEFWSKYFITKKTLIKFDVEPIDYYWINLQRFKCDKMTYVYTIGDKYKIYAPYSEYKWASNTNTDSIQGWDQLPATGDVLIITSSLKDVMCLYELGFFAIAFQSEVLMPKEEIILELKRRFANIIIFYDNDFDKEENTGQTMANKICSLYSVQNIFLEPEFETKDISDFVKTYRDKELAKSLIAQDILKKCIKYEEE